MANYLVTGAAGFIAARVTEMLLADGHTVFGVDNLNDAYDVRIKHYRLAQLKTHPGFRFEQLDIADREAIAALPPRMGKVEAVFNLAARAGVRTSLENPWVYVDTNLTGTLNLLELCRQEGVKKFILASTSSIYGADAPLPTPESAESSTPLQPYAASKKAAETMAYAYHFLYDLDVTVFRYFTVYGPAGRPDMVMFRFAQWLFEGQRLRLNGDGEQQRGFTYVDDIARGTILGLKTLGYEIINLGGHEMISINQLISMLEERIGARAEIDQLPFHKADMTANWADVSKAGRLLGWEAQVGIEEGVSRLVDWYRQQRSWAKEIDTAG